MGVEPEAIPKTFYKLRCLGVSFNLDLAAGDVGDLRVAFGPDAVAVQNSGGGVARTIHDIVIEGPLGPF